MAMSGSPGPHVYLWVHLKLALVRVPVWDHLKQRAIRQTSDVFIRDHLKSALVRVPMRDHLKQF